MEHKERFVQVPKRINKEYKNLNVIGLKLYYYIFSKFQSKALAFRKVFENNIYNDNSELEIDYFEMYDDKVTISFRELEEYLNVKRLRYENLYKAVYEELPRYFSIDFKENNIEITSGNHLINIIRQVDTVQKNDKIYLSEISKLKDANTIRFYLYCNTFKYAKQQTININKLKMCLTGDTVIADKVFYDKLIIASKNIYQLLGIKIKVSKKKDNLYLKFEQ